MTSTMRLLVALGCAALLAGCGAGRNFKMPAEDQLKLGVTTPKWRRYAWRPQTHCCYKL